VATVHVFVSFDIDHDNDCKERLEREVMPAASHFVIDDWSIREVALDWRTKARKRIENIDLLLVICGEHAETAANVNDEVELAREAGVPYLLIGGRDSHSQKPKTATERDRILEWNSHRSWSSVVPAR
jgi:hypothetical protein